MKNCPHLPKPSLLSGLCCSCRDSCCRCWSSRSSGFLKCVDQRPSVCVHRVGDRFSLAVFCIYSICRWVPSATSPLSLAMDPFCIASLQSAFNLLLPTALSHQQTVTVLFLCVLHDLWVFSTASALAQLFVRFCEWPRVHSVGENCLFLPFVFYPSINWVRKRTFSDGSLVS